MAAEVIGDGFEIPVRAEVEVDFDAARVRSLSKEFGKTGYDMGKQMAKQFVSQLGPMNDGLRESIGGLEGPAADKMLNRFFSFFKAGFREAAQAADAAYDDVRRSGTAAAEATAAAFTQAAQGTEDARGGSSRFNRELKETLDLAEGLEAAFEAVFKAIAADLQLLRGELSAGIVDKQARMQQDGILKAQRQMVAQAQKDENRERRILLQAGLREQEQLRQAANRESLLQQRNAGAQENSVLNSSLQEELIQERAHQQRRSALIRAGLDATRSAYQSVGSGVSSVVSAMYSKMRSDTESGESRITASNRAGLLRRKEQTETIMRQTTAEVRKQIGLYQQTQQKLDRGVIGAVAGTSAFGAGLRGLALGGAGGLFSASGLSAFTSWESAFAGVTKTVDGTTAELALLHDQILAMAKTVPSTAEEIAGVAESAGQLGIQTPKIIDFAKVIIDLGNSTNVTAAEAADLLAQFANVTQMPQDQFQNLGSTIVALGNNFASTESDIIAMSQRLASAGTIAGLAPDQILALSNALASVGINAEAGGSAFSNIIIKMTKSAWEGAEASSEWAKAAGLTGQAFVDLMKNNPSEAISKVVIGLGQMHKEGKNVFEMFADLDVQEIRQSNALRSLASSGDLFARSLVVGNQAWTENTALVTEATIRYKTFESRVKITKERVRAILREFGQGVAGIAGAGLNIFNPILDNVEEFVGVMRDVASAPQYKIVRDALLGIGAGLAAVAAAKAGIEALRLTGLIIGAMASPLGIVAIGVAAVGAAIMVLLRGSEPLRRALGEVRDNLLGVGGAVGESGLGRAREIFDTIRRHVERAATTVGLFVALLINDDMRKQFIEWQKLPPDIENQGIFGFFLRARDTTIEFIQTLRDTFDKAEGVVERFTRSSAFDTLRAVLLGSAGGLVALGVGLKALAAARPAVTVLKTMMGVLGGLTSPLGIAALGVAGIAGGLVLLYRNSQGFRDFIDLLVDRFRDFADVIGEAAGPAIDGFLDAIGGVAGAVSGAVDSAMSAIASFVSSDGFIGALSAVGDVLGAVVTRVAGAVEDIVTFFTAASRTINELGIFEGLRQSAIVAFEGVTAALGFIFGGLFDELGSLLSEVTSFISDKFSQINWPAVLTTVAAGIFGFFFTIGNTIGEFIGSDEFLGTVTAALALVAGVVATAAAGLVSGFIDGLRRSDMGRRVGGAISEELSGAWDVVRQELVDAATLILSGLFPPIAIKRWITDPFESGFSTLVAIATGYVGIKLVGVFATAFQAINNSVQGFRQVPLVLNGGLEAISGSMDAASQRAKAHEATLKQVTDRYGRFPGLSVRAAAAVNNLGGKFGLLAKDTGAAATSTEKLGSHLRGPLVADVRAVATASNDAAGATKAMEEEVSSFRATYVAAVAGLGAGVGIGAAITADDPLGKIAGIGTAIAGLGTIAVSTQQVIAASGLTAGLLTGGIGVAVTAITAAVTYFATRGKAAKAATEEIAAASEQYVRSFSTIISTTNGAQGATALEFFSRLNDTGSSEFEDFRTAVQSFGLDMQGAARAVTGTEGAYAKWAGNIQGYIDDNVDQINRWKKEVDDLPDPGMGDSAYTPEQRDLMDQIRLLEERNELLRDSLITIGGARKAYEEALSVASEELLIRRNMKTLEDERKTAQQLLIDKRREERDAVNEVAQSMRDLIGLEEGRRAANAGLNLREQARQIAESQRPEEGRELAPFDISGALGGQVTEGADNAMRALQQLQDAFADTAAEAAASTQTAEDYMVALALQQMALEKLLVDSGMKPEDARILAEAVVAPFREAEAVVAALIARIGDDLATLKQRMEGSDANFGLGDIQNEEARKAIEQFLEDPSEKTIKTLVDMGIPTKAIEDFVRDPKEATIKTIVDSVTFLDAQGKLNGFKAPIDTVVRPVVDPASKAAVDAARAEVGQGIAIPFVFVPGKMEKKKVFGFGPMQNQNVIVPAGNKYGSVISEPTLTWVGEEKRKEVIIPLTMPQRAAQLYKESGLGNVLAQAGVGGTSAGAEAPAGGGRTDTAVVDEIRKMRTDLQGMAEERMDVRMYLTRDPADLKSARTVVRGMRARRRRG